MSTPERHPARLDRRCVPTAVAALCALLLLQAPIASLAAVRSRLDRSRVSEGGQVTLDIESDSAASGAEPDLSPLKKDFVVLGSATQSDTSIVNGTLSNRHRWSVRLQPRRAGVLPIPPIAIGDEHTAALQLDVAAPSPQATAETARHVFMEVQPLDAGRSVYVQQQVPYAVRLYFDDTVQKGELAAPSTPDAVVEQLGEEKHGTATRNGHSYNVIERTYAVSPEKSGTLRIPPMTFNGSQVVPQSPQAQGAAQDDADPGDDVFASMLRNTPFANDPLFRRGLAAGMPPAQETQPISVQSNEIVLDVKPRAAGARGDWLPAEAITLHDSWQDSPPQLKAGEPATRTITVEAKGLSASQIPPLSPTQPTNARLYLEAADNQSRTDGKTIIGISTQKLTYIPDAQGRLDVPAVQLAWWDVRADAAREATLPALALSVAPGVAGVASRTPSPGSAGQLASTTLAPSANVTRPAPSGTGAAWWRRLVEHRTGLAAAGLLVAAVGVALGDITRRSRRRRAGAADAGANGLKSTLAPAPRKSAGLRALQQACVADNPHAAASALHDLALAQWPDDPPLGLGALASRLERGAAEVRGLERCLYSAAGASSWKGAALWQVSHRGLQPRHSETALQDEDLMALYPLQRRPVQSPRAL